MNPTTIRPATMDDVPDILGFIRELAVYEKLEHQCVATEDQLRATLFGDRPFANVLMAEWEGKSVGFALYFYNYSTFLAKPGIYLEDLYVQPEYRGKGLGKALLLELAKEAEKMGAGRVEWSVLDWNEPSIEFYKSLGAIPMDEWTVYRLTENAIQVLNRKEETPA